MREPDGRRAVRCIAHGAVKHRPDGAKNPGGWTQGGLPDGSIDLLGRLCWRGVSSYSTDENEVWIEAIRRVAYPMAEPRVTGRRIATAGELKTCEGMVMEGTYGKNDMVVVEVGARSRYSLAV